MFGLCVKESYVFSLPYVNVSRANYFGSWIQKRASQ